MAREKLGDSILESRLGSLKKDLESVQTLTNSLKDSFGALGPALSQSIRTAKSEIHGLESALKGLETQMKRSATTGSSIGAANVSASLEQLTGQGRTYGGGGAGYGGAGGGPRGIGGGAARQAEGAFKALDGFIKKRLGPVGGALYEGIKAPISLQGGMAWAAAKQGLGLGEQWEQMARYTRGMGPGYAGSSGRGAGFKDLAKIGVDVMEGAGTLGALQSQLGYSRRAGAWDIRNIHALGHATGMQPQEYMSTWGAARAGGMELPQSFQLSRELQLRSRGIARGQLGLTEPGAGASDKQKRAYEERIFPRAQYNQRQFMGGINNLIQQQVGGTGAISADQQARMQGLIGSLAGPGGNFAMQPGVASQMGAMLGRASAAPGGGEAGQLFMMRAAGFGNPMLDEYKKTARDMGIDPTMFQRRNFLESKLFLEDDPVRRIQAMMVGIGAEYGPGRGPGYQQSRILALESMAGKEGMTYTLAKKLFADADKGALSDDEVRSRLSEYGLTPEGMAGGKAPIPGEVTADVGGKSIIKSQAQLNRSLLGMRRSIAGLNDVVTKFQVSSVNSITEAIKGLDAAFRVLNVDQATVDTFYTPLTEFVEKMKDLIILYQQSDIRLKTDIDCVGTSPSGIPIYEFCYKRDPKTRWRGVMAQDILLTHPDAVLLGADGYYCVRYDKLDVDMELVKHTHQASAQI